MKIGQPGLALIKFYEGIKETKGMCHPYICPTGHPTIGWGCTTDMAGNTVTMKTKPITLTEAEKLLTKRLAYFEAVVTRLVKVPLTQGQFDALVSFTFNMGEGNFGSSTLLKKLNAKDYVGASKEFIRWNKGRVNGALVELDGLTKRRTAERQLFLTL